MAQPTHKPPSLKELLTLRADLARAELLLTPDQEATLKEIVQLIDTLPEGARLIVAREAEKAAMEASFLMRFREKRLLASFQGQDQTNLSPVLDFWNTMVLQHVTPLADETSVWEAFLGGWDGTFSGAPSANYKWTVRRFSKLHHLLHQAANTIPPDRNFDPAFSE